MIVKLSSGTGQRRLTFLVAAVATIVTGLVVHLRGTALPAAARDFAGDALWGMMIAWWMGVVAPRARLVPRGTCAFLICAAVEFSQRFHGAAIDAIRQTTVGHLVLGSGFDTRDLLAYAIGIVMAAVLEVSVLRPRDDHRAARRL